MPEVVLIAVIVALLAGALLFVRARRPRSPAAPEVETSPTQQVELEAQVEPAPRPAPAEPAGLRQRLQRSRRFLSARLAEVLGGGVTDDTWEDLEAVLIQADVGVGAAARLVEGVRQRARAQGLSSLEDLQDLLAAELLARFDPQRERGLALAPEGPTVWLIAGVNGSGKTTTIGKLANDQRAHGRSVALAAADTFRAAADEQLLLWAERAGAHVVKHQPGADPGAVAYDAYAYARARGIDVLLVDTAGRLHTKTPLMDELAKVKRVIEKDGAVHEVLLVIDATTGQNGLVQAREFATALGVTGVVLTKLDGTAKGGIALAIEETLGIPIKLIGVGEGIADIEPFDPKSFVDALLA